MADDSYAGKTDRELLVEIHTKLGALTEECCTRGIQFEKVKLKVERHDTYLKILGGALAVLCTGLVALITKL